MNVIIKDIPKKHCKIKAMFGVICTISVIDTQRNNISLIDVITQLNVQNSDFENVKAGGHKGLSIPYRHEVVVMFRKLGAHGIDSGELNYDVKISFVNPQEEIIAEFLTPIKFLPNVKTHGHKINLDNFIVQSEGSYEYRVSVMERGDKDFNELCTIPLIVEKVN